MIDYNRPDEDPIVAEVRKAREEYAARFDYDLKAIFDELMRHQAGNPQDYVTLPPRRVEHRSLAVEKNSR